MRSFIASLTDSRNQALRRRSRATKRGSRHARPSIELLEDRAVPTAGTLDTTFNPNPPPNTIPPGTVTTSFGPLYDEVHALASQPDGKIVIVGDKLGNQTARSFWAAARTATRQITTSPWPATWVIHRILRGFTRLLS